MNRLRKIKKSALEYRKLEMSKLVSGHQIDLYDSLYSLLSLCLCNFRDANTTETSC